MEDRSTHEVRSEAADQLMAWTSIGDELMRVRILVQQLQPQTDEPIRDALYTAALDTYQRSFDMAGRNGLTQLSLDWMTPTQKQLHNELIEEATQRFSPVLMDAKQMQVGVAIQDRQIVGVSKTYQVRNAPQDSRLVEWLSLLDELRARLVKPMAKAATEGVFSTASALPIDAVKSARRLDVDIPNARPLPRGRLINLNERFAQARLKHVRANEHVHAVNLRWQRFLQTDFCKLVVENDAQGPGQRLRVQSIEPLSADLLLAVGDAVHNLKSALDYAISEILGHKNTRLTFPMGESIEELISSFKTEEIIACQACKRSKGKGRNALIEEAAPGFGKWLVDEIRPYKAADGYLWPLNKLDVRDKHRLLVPVLVPQSVTVYDVVDGYENTISEMTGTVGSGGIVNLVHFGGGGVKIGRYGKPTAEMFFNEPGIIEGKRVVPTLVQMAQAVAETIDSIDRFLTDSKWPGPPKKG